jgi:hypothetical protein
MKKSGQTAMGKPVVNETQKQIDAAQLDPPVETIETALASGAVQGAERREYAAQLLAYALQTRDAEASYLLAQLMDSDKLLDAELEPLLSEATQDQPDAVYAFVRAHLVEQGDERWLSRLKMAALWSLRVAINDADADTIVKWLTLIAREPAHYNLADVLHYGILAAQERAHHEPELAKNLISLAAKRDPDSLDALLDDRALLAVLPNTVGEALRDYQGDLLALRQNKGLELFLVGVARAARACASDILNPGIVAGVWELYLNDQIIGNLPAHYQPEAIVNTWIEKGVNCLEPEALEMLASLMLGNRRDEQFLQLLSHPNGVAVLLPHLVSVLERGQRTIIDAVNLIGRLTASNAMLPQQVAGIYTTMLDGLEWRREGVPLIQELAQTLKSHPEVELPPEIYWRLMEKATEFKDEQIARVAARRLTLALCLVEDDPELVENLRRVAEGLLWNEVSRAFLTKWWRGYVREQSTARLARLEKVLNGKRSLEAERAVLQTTIAMRRLLGQRDLREFAAAIETAYSILDELSDSFDSTTKRSMRFDLETARAELETRDNQLSTQEQQVLGNNLKELARLIAAMGDSRTHANLLKREDDLERELMSGEETPHSAVDTMKWMAGYWGVAREEAEES